MMSTEKFKLIPAVYVILRRGDKVLLSKRANTGYQDGKYSLVAGHIDGDEVATEAMIREAQEEIGVTIKKESLKFVHLAHRLSKNKDSQEKLDLFFECREWQGEIENKEPAKCDDLSWFPIEQLPSETIPLVKLVLNHVAEGNPYSEYESEPV